MYKAQNVDTDKALEALNDARKMYSREHSVKQREMNKYYEGVSKGLDIAESIFLCSNYEKDGKNNDKN